MSVRSRRRRAAIAMVLVLAFVGVLVVRLVDLQVVRADELDAQSAKARGQTQTIYGTRGSIVDAAGTVLAKTVMRYNFIASPMNTTEPFTRTGKNGATTKVGVQQACAEIAAITGQNPDDLVAMITAALKENPKSQYAPLVQDVDVATYNKIKALRIPWLDATSHQTRVYPNGAVAGNLVGFVDGAGKAQAGLELGQNACLAGRNGLETYETGLDGVTIPGSTTVTEKAKNGGTVMTTLDSDLTWYADQQLAQQVPALGAQFGMVNVIEAKTGKIRVAAQYPSPDPNNLDGTSTEYWKAMMFQNMYEPGSIFKPLTAAALIDSGKATPQTHVQAPDTLRPGDGVLVRDDETHDVQNLTLTGVLTESSNVGISMLGTKLLSDQQRYDYMRKFGIGQKTAVGFPDESSGQLNPPAEWDAQTRYATTFGQGVSASPAQMLSAYQILANGGVRVPLTLVDGCKQADGTVTGKPSTKGTRVISKEAAQETLNMLENVLKGGPLSTLPPTEIAGYVIAAKTGTAQEPDGHGGYLPHYYVSIMAVAPVDDPQYVVSVNLGYPTTITSSLAARPLFKDIMSQVLKTYRVKPSTTPESDYPDTY